MYVEIILFDYYMSVWIGATTAEERNHNSVWIETCWARVGKETVDWFV